MEEVLSCFNERGIRYVVIGGQAVRLWGVPRFSMDWDLLIPPRDTGNIAAINSVLRDELDVPLEPLGPRGEGFVQTYQTRWGIIQFHLGGPGLPEFEVASGKAAFRETESGVPVPCLDIESLVASKRKANRPQDIQDVEYLEALGRLKTGD